MTTEIISGAPQPERRGQRRRPGEQPQILSREEILALLSRLPVLVLAGVVSPATANAMRAAYSDILRHLEQAGGRPAEKVSMGSDLMHQLRKNPKLANLLEPYLSESDLDSLMGADDRPVP